MRLPAFAGVPSGLGFPQTRIRSAPHIRALVLRAGAGLLLTSMLSGLLSAYVGWQLTHPGRKALSGAPSMPYRDVTFPSSDSLQLSGWFLDAASNRTVILVHGYRENRLQENVPGLDVAEGLVGNGYNVLMFDLRDSGSSAGSLTTIGVFEQRDVLGAIAYVHSLGRPAEHVALLGFSMGAATALLTAGHGGDAQAVISDSAFADLYPYLQDNLTVWSHLPTFPFTPLILGLEPAITGADPRLADPIHWVGKISAPILFIHGLADGSIPYRNSEELARAATNPASELWLVPGADHVKSFETDRQGYWQHLLPFLDRALS